MMFADISDLSFQSACSEVEFIGLTCSALSRLGFVAENTIACVSVCRDEISQSLVEIINSRWGYTFNLSSLAGMLLTGRTGLLAAMHHAPNMDGKERYVFYAMPHIAIDEGGRIGACLRTGRQGESTACGALNIFLKEVAEGKVNPIIDFNDIELSLIRMKLLRMIPRGEIPGLFELTKIAQKAIQLDLELTLRDNIDITSSDYAVITGIQVHKPDGNYVWPVSCYSVVEGDKRELELE